MLSSPTVKTSLIFIAIALVGLVFADIAITAANPWKDLGRFSHRDSWRYLWPLSRTLRQEGKANEDSHPRGQR